MDGASWSARFSVVCFLLTTHLVLSHSFAQGQEATDRADANPIPVKVASIEPASIPTARDVPSVAPAPQLVQEHPSDLAVAPTRVLDDAARELARQRLTKLVEETTTALWKGRVEETLGDVTEVSTTRVVWAGPEQQRIKILSGRGAGKTLVVQGDIVRAGWMKFHHTSRTVKTLRGNSLKLNGYLDDFRFILDQWEHVHIEHDMGKWMVAFIDPTGLDLKIWIDPSTLIAGRCEAYDSGKLVGRYEYESVVYNPELPANVWKK